MSGFLLAKMTQAANFLRSGDCASTAPVTGRTSPENTRLTILEVRKVTLPYLMKMMAITAVAAAGNLPNSFLSDKLTPGLYFPFKTPIK